VERRFCSLFVIRFWSQPDLPLITRNGRGPGTTPYAMDPIRYMFGVPMVGIGTWFYVTAVLYGYGVGSAASPLSGITLALFGATAMFSGYGLLAPSRIGRAVKFILMTAFFVGALHLLRTAVVFAMEQWHQTGALSKPGTQIFALLYGALSTGLLFALCRASRQQRGGKLE
jgi:hypothetical protein